MLAPLYRPRAAYDLESIVIYLGEVQKVPKSARKVYDSIVESIDHLCETPELGRPFADERLSHQGYRSWLVSPYRIFYSFNSENLIVWRIIHTRQDIDDFAFIDIDG